MLRTFNTHLTMGIRVGSNVRLDARMSIIQAGGKTERVNLTELATSQDGAGPEGFDAGLAVFTAGNRLVDRVCAELRNRGLNATADELQKVYAEEITDAESAEQKLHSVVGFVDEIQWHTFSENSKE